MSLNRILPFFPCVLFFKVKTYMETSLDECDHTDYTTEYALNSEPGRSSNPDEDTPLY